jgi:hypothetical protein
MALQLINKGAEFTDVSIESAFSIMDEPMLSAMIDKLLLKGKKNEYIGDGVLNLIALSESLPKKFKEGAQEKTAGLLLRAGSEISDSVMNGISLKAYCQPLMIPTLDLCIQENDLKGALNILNRCHEVYQLELYPQAQSLFSKKWPNNVPSQLLPSREYESELLPGSNRKKR